MVALKTASPTILLVAAMWCLPGAARAGDFNTTANAQRIHAMIATQSMLGYPPVADVDRSGCCCPNSAAAGYATSTLQQQITTLSAALKQTPEPANLSPAQLAEGAY